MKASQKRILRKFGRGWTLVEMLVVVGMIGSLAAISFPVYKSIQKRVEKQQTEMMWSSLERAVDNFETEYNHMPYVGNVYPDADFLFKEENGDITKFTSILAGVGTNCNFKKIKFFEYKEPKGGPGSYKDGLLVNNTQATLYKPWLVDNAPAEYRRTLLDNNMDGEVANMTALVTGGPWKVNFVMWDWGPDKNWFTLDDNASNLDIFD